MALLFPGRALLRSLPTSLALAASLFMAQVSFAAEPVFPQGVSIGLEPPPGMTPSAKFSGFEHRSGASIVVVEMPAEAYPDIVSKFTPEQLKATGFVASGPSEALPLPSGEGRIFRGKQSANGLSYVKWLALAKGPNVTALVTAQVPEAAQTQVPAKAVEAALRSIVFRAERPMSEQIATLPFTVGDMAGFRPVRVFLGNSLLLTDGPKDVDPDAEQPMVVITPAIGKVTIGPGQEEAIARRIFLAGMPQLKDLAVSEEGQPEGAARKGDTDKIVRIKGTAKDARSGKPMGVVQTMMFRPDGYLRIIAIAPSGGDALARADRIAASVTRR